MENWNKEHAEKRTVGQRVADVVAGSMGSWTFIIIQTILIAIWIIWNTH